MNIDWKRFLKAIGVTLSLGIGICLLAWLIYLLPMWGGPAVLCTIFFIFIVSTIYTCLEPSHKE